MYIAHTISMVLSALTFASNKTSQLLLARQITVIQVTNGQKQELRINSNRTNEKKPTQSNDRTEQSNSILFRSECETNGHVLRRRAWFSMFFAALPLLWRLTEKHASAYVCRRNRRGLSEFSVDIGTQWMKRVFYSNFWLPLNSNIKWKSSLIWATKQEKSTPFNRRFLWLWKFLMNKNTVRFGFQHISSQAFVHIKFVCFV